MTFQSLTNELEDWLKKRGQQAANAGGKLERYLGVTRATPIPNPIKEPKAFIKDQLVTKPLQSLKNTGSAAIELLNLPSYAIGGSLKAIKDSKGGTKMNGDYKAPQIGKIGKVSLGELINPAIVGAVRGVKNKEAVFKEVPKAAGVNPSSAMGIALGLASEVAVPSVGPGKVKNIMKGSQDLIDIAKTRYALDSKAVIPEIAKESALKRGLNNLLQPISSRLNAIAPELKDAIRQLEFDSAQSTLRDTRKIVPLLKDIKKLSKEDALIFDLARKNGEQDVIQAISQKYNLDDSLASVRSVLDDIFKRAKEVGIKIGYKENYSPRVIKDSEGFLDFLKGTESWSGIQEAITTKAKELGKTLNINEQAEIANNLLRGFSSSRINLSRPGAAKERTVDFITSDLNKFYESADASLVNYVQRMNDEIAARKFFGKGKDVDESIGALVAKLTSEGKLSPSQEAEVSSILKSRFSKGKMNEALSTYRNFEYLSTMGSPLSAITQIGDLAFSMYENGLVNAAKGLTKAVTGRGIRKEDLGIDQIAQEFTDRSKSAKAVETTFKLIGLDKMDRIGKETFINGAFSNFISKAKKNSPELISELQRVFKEDAPRVLDELKNKQLTDDTRYLLFSKLLDYQPIAKSEMPAAYLNNPNGRIFYMLKSFALKQLDVFRRESFSKIASGNPKEIATGIKNFTLLGGGLIAANATADEIKDFITGRDTPLSDKVIDNLARLVMLSKYDAYKAREQGLGRTLLGKILPPTSVYDNVSKDLNSVITDKEYKTGANKGEDYGLESVQSIPLVGKLYYWWFGRGAQKNENKAKTSSNATGEYQKASSTKVGSISTPSTIKASRRVSRGGRKPTQGPTRKLSMEKFFKNATPAQTAYVKLRYNIPEVAVLEKSKDDDWEKRLKEIATLPEIDYLA